MKNVKKGFSLSDEEVDFFRGKLRSMQGAKNYRLRNRVKGVLPVGCPTKLKHKEVAHRCKIHARTPRDWLAHYRTGKFEGLKRKPVSGCS